MSDSEFLYVGIDVSKASNQVYAMDSDEKKFLFFFIVAYSFLNVKGLTKFSSCFILLSPCARHRQNKIFNHIFSKGYCRIHKIVLQ